MSESKGNESRMTKDSEQYSPIRNAGQPFETQTADQVKRYYDEKTGAYLEGFGEVFQGSRPEMVDDLLSYIMKAANLWDGIRILDAGCGVCGPSTYFAQHANLKIEALTISPVQVAKAQERIRSFGLESQITVREGDFHKLAELYEPESFDRVLFLETICHAREYRTVLEQAMRLLKPGGLLYIKDFYCQDFRSKPELRETQLADLHKLNRVYQLALPDLPSLVDLVQELGFILQYLREPGYHADFVAWAHYEQVAAESWSPKLSYMDLIAGVELCCRKPEPRS